MKFHDQGSKTKWRILFWIIFVEVILGTWSREQVDSLKGSSLLYLEGDLNGMLNYVGMDWLFMVHRFVPGAILVYSFWEFWKSRKLLGANPSNLSNPSNPNTTTSPWFILFILSLLQICLGAIHIVYVVPAWTQIAHVVFGSALLTYSYLVYISYKKESS